MSSTPPTPEPDPGANAEDLSAYPEDLSAYPEDLSAYQEDLSAYLDGELSPAECARVEEALAQDPGLRAALADLEEISRTLRTLPTLRAPDTVLSNVRSEISPKHPSLFRQFGMQGFLGWAALILIAVTAGIWFFGDGSSDTSPESSLDSFARVTENAPATQDDDDHSDAGHPVAPSAAPPSEAARIGETSSEPRLGKRSGELSMKADGNELPASGATWDSEDPMPRSESDAVDGGEVTPRALSSHQALEKKLGSDGEPAGSIEPVESEDTPKKMTLGERSAAVGAPTAETSAPLERNARSLPPPTTSKDASAGSSEGASESKREKRSGTRGGSAGATGGKSVAATASGPTPTRDTAPTLTVPRFFQELGAEAIAARLERGRTAEREQARRHAGSDGADVGDVPAALTIRVPIPLDTPPEQLAALRTLLLDPSFALGAEVGTTVGDASSAPDSARGDPAPSAPRALEFRGAADTAVALENLRALAAWSSRTVGDTSDLGLPERRTSGGEQSAGEKSGGESSDRETASGDDARAGFAEVATHRWTAPGGLRFEGGAAIVEVVRRALGERARSAEETLGTPAPGRAPSEAPPTIRARIILEPTPVRPTTESEPPHEDTPRPGNAQE